MKKIGIAMDSWKFELFKARLTRAGFTYIEVVEGDKYNLIVHTADSDGLHRVIHAANKEAQKIKAEMN